MTDTTDTLDAPAAPAATYSEQQVADLLNIKRSTLAYHRKHGHLAPGVLAERTGLYVGRTTPMAYNAEKIDRVKAGKAQLFAD